MKQDTPTVERRGTYLEDGYCPDCIMVSTGLAAGVRLCGAHREASRRGTVESRRSNPDVDAAYRILDAMGWKYAKETR